MVFSLSDLDCECIMKKEKGGKNLGNENGDFFECKEGKNITVKIPRKEDVTEVRSVWTNTVEESRTMKTEKMQIDLSITGSLQIIQIAAC